MSFSKALTDCSLELVAFSTISQSQQSGLIMSLIVTTIFSKSLSWLISQFLADPRYLPVLTWQSHLASWPDQHYQLLDFLSIRWNVAPYLGGTVQNVYLQRNPLILISYICTTHPRLRYHFRSFDRWLIVKWITVWCCTGSWWGRKRISSFPLSLLALLECFLFLIEEKLSLVGLWYLPL